MSLNSANATMSGSSLFQDDDTRNVGVVPPALRPGDTIALLSPSSRLNTIFPLRLTRAIAALTTLGFRVKVFFTPLSPRADNNAADHIRAEIQHRVTELHDAFADQDVKAVVTTIGGLSSNELLPYIDWAIIQQNPKIFCGYSDITLLHHAIFHYTGLRTFYGPAAITQFAEIPEPLEFTLKHFLRVLSPDTENLGKPIGLMPRSETFTDEFGDWGQEDKVLKPRRLEKHSGWEWLRKGKCVGRLTGGCLPSLLQLAGTKYWPSIQGKILLLENPEGENPDGPMPLVNTRSLMADLVNLEVFDQIVGLVVGRPTGYKGEELEGYKEVVLGMCTSNSRQFPILFGVDVGHTDPLLTVPLNALAGLNSEKDSWEILEPSVRGA